LASNNNSKKNAYSNLGLAQQAQLNISSKNRLADAAT
jgi:hypothetical protein